MNPPRWLKTASSCSSYQRLSHRCGHRVPQLFLVRRGDTQIVFLFTVSRPVREDLGRTTCFHGEMRISKSDSSLWGPIGKGVGPRGDSDWLGVSLREPVSVPPYRIPKPATCPLPLTCGTTFECSEKAGLWTRLCLLEEKWHQNKCPM